MASSNQADVSLELLLALDVSKSIDADEFRLQKQGIAHAFRQPEVVSAIQNASGSSVAVGLMQWSSFTEWARPALWMEVRDRADAEILARKVAHITRMNRQGSTGIGRALARGVRELRTNRFDGKRKIIDIIGDGRSNVGVKPSKSRDFALSKGVTINALAILTEDSKLDQYFRDEVIGGDASFVISTENYRTFTHALILKIQREFANKPHERKVVYTPNGLREHSQKTKRVDRILQLTDQ